MLKQALSLKKHGIANLFATFNEVVKTKIKDLKSMISDLQVDLRNVILQTENKDQLVKGLLEKFSNETEPQLESIAKQLHTLHMDGKVLADAFGNLLDGSKLVQISNENPTVLQSEKILEVHIPFNASSKCDQNLIGCTHNALLDLGQKLKLLHELNDSLQIRISERNGPSCNWRSIFQSMSGKIKLSCLDKPSFSLTSESGRTKMDSLISGPTFLIATQETLNSIDISWNLVIWQIETS